MTTIMQAQSNQRHAQAASLDQARQLAEKLLSERGEATGARVSRELHDVLRGLDARARHGFQLYLAASFQPDSVALRTAAERYLAGASAEAAAALAQAAPGGAAALEQITDFIANRSY